MSIDKIITEAKQLQKDGKLVPLKNPFGGEVFFEPVQLDVEKINYPSSARPTEMKDFLIKSFQDLEQCGSFISSEANPTISIFDDLKTQAAIGDCNAWGDEETPFLLVSADFSGIQDTVYTISSKGALKTLRARSFMLELLTEHIIYELVGENRYQIIYSGGGGFSLLMPNTQANRDAGSKFHETLNKWAIKEFSGKFFIALDAYPFADINKFSDAREKQSENLDKRKRRKFLNQLGTFFTPQMPKQTIAQTECQITRRDDLEDNEMCDLESGDEMNAQNKKEENRVWVSKSCYRQYKIGDELIDATYVYRSEAASPKYYFAFPTKSNGLAYYYITSNTPAQNPRWKINDFEDGCYTLWYANYVRKVSDLPLFAKDIENKVATEEQRETKQDYTATFDGLAAASCGADLIGALRMDVDNLGKNFQAVKTPMELSQKSRLLNLFFKGFLNVICAGKLNGLTPTNILHKDYTNGRNVSVIYAGGDDLFIVGAWDETAELAFDIQKCFHQFTGGDENKSPNRLGISGGLTLHHPKFPLYQMAKKSGEAESVAKNDKEKGEDTPHKNRISFFYADTKEQRKEWLAKKENYMLSMKWSLANEFLLSLMKVYGDCGRTKEINQRIVFEIDKFSSATIEKWFAVIEKHQETGKLYLPTMARVMSQIQKDPKMDEDLFKKLTGYLYTNDKSKQNWISHLHIALNWLSYLRRTK
jgi:CRISPR-associated protein Csm1